MLLGAAIGVISNGISNLSQGNNFFQGGLKAAAFGAIGGAFASGIGQAASQITNEFAKATFQTVAHGTTSGVMSGIQGGSFSSGLASGALSSVVSSGASAVGVGNTGMIGVGGLSGGVGSHLAGGDFWTGVGQGVITSGLNHAAHSGMFGDNLAASLRTGRFRHLFGPDATYEGYGLRIYGLGGAFFEWGGLQVLKGPDAGLNLDYLNFGTGVGLQYGSYNTSGKIYYAGWSSNFKALMLAGSYIGVTGGVSVGPLGGSGGLNLGLKRIPGNSTTWNGII
jgi:hypothetical protein